MPFAALPDVTLRFERHGAGSGGTPLVLLHGAMETFEACWKKPLPGLAERRPVIGVDLRGHGQSDNPAGVFDGRQMADDIAALLDTLGEARADVCGFSAGAAIALHLALRHPERVRALIVISNNVTRDVVRAATNFWDPERQRREEGVWWQFLLKVHRDAPEHMLRAWAAEDAVRPDFSQQELAALRMPALVMAGDRDPIVPIEESVRLYQWLPNARLAVFPGTGHGLHRHNTPRFVEMANAFLDRV